MAPVPTMHTRTEPVTVGQVGAAISRRAIIARGGRDGVRTGPLTAMIPRRPPTSVPTLADTVAALLASHDTGQALITVRATRSTMPPLGTVDRLAWD